MRVARADEHGLGSDAEDRNHRSPSRAEQPAVTTRQCHLRHGLHTLMPIDSIATNEKWTGQNGSMGTSFEATAMTVKFLSSKAENEAVSWRGLR